eukprot:CAMPEP_0197644292 /NCGR_PEP_ID=MMETSP1338-20131121/17317_1 /TAXON_ID=43686 ORGANISM="Pelagodinium beii, Strain RCC1491" /NCGR_SAMPLE_ID=MMETSP1338 /ASSEMBLY_ACC=CAM_ASM_000754 /LENGTH=121 /DNA_ID=CAMNT_0043217663 /DNA_START=709 /DNA_END=1074 /DNA_ORIENTATION=+
MKLIFAVAFLAGIEAEKASPGLRGDAKHALLQEDPVDLDYETEAEACDACGNSYTKVGKDPYGAIADGCVCFAHKEEGGTKFKSLCAAQPSAVGYVQSLEGCTCKFKDMENMGKTTCQKIG